MAKTAAATADAVTTTYPALEIASIESSGLNPRTHWDADADRELEESIRADGVLEPIIVRPHPAKGNVYQIVAGERRFRAACAVGLGQVPAVIRVVSDEKLLELALTENIQRRSMHPLDEANGFIKRLEMGGCSPEALASSLGLSKRYITDRIRLKKLGKKAAAMLESGRMSVSHAILLARLEPRDQDLAIYQNSDNALDLEPGPASDKEKLVMRALHDLKEWINENVRLDPASIETQEEFPELVDELKAAAVEGATITMLSESWAIHGAKPKAGDPLFSGDWDECKKTDKGAQIGIIVEGRGRGQKVYWKPKQKYTSSAPSKPRKLSADEQKRRERELADQRRQREQQQAWNTLKPKAKAAFQAHIEKLPIKQVLAILERKNGALEHDGTAEGFLRAYAAKQHSYSDHNADAFSYGTKGTGFDVKKWFKAEAAALKKTPAKAVKAKKR